MFQRKGTIELDAEKVSEDEVMEIALDAGADDIVNEDGIITVTTAPDAFAAVADALADKGIELDFTFVDKRNCHDRFIETDTGWYIDCGRGLHIYQNVNPNQNFLTIGTYDQELRPCLACTINYSKKTKQ